MEQSLDIDNLANEACFATNYQTKSKAQQTFYTLCMNLTQAQLEQLMLSYSETVLFVTMEYIYKVIPSFKDRKQYFLVINRCAELWYATNNNSMLMRNGTQKLQLYVQNSVGRTLGQCLKNIYLVKEDSVWVTNFIKERQNHRYRLYLWSLFIETVSVVDNDLTFLVYRSMVYNFQEFVIPEIMDSLLPYFNSVRQQIEINDLSSMQAHLSVSDQGNSQSSNEKIELFNPAEVRFTELVFNVLKEIICFNYNITYSEYESEVPIDNCLVSFPDPVTKKIANQQFLKSIFFVAEKLISDTNPQLQSQNNLFLSTTLECIQKIMLTKLFYTSQETKQQFVKTILICLSRLMSMERLTEQIILSLIESNLKLLINIELHQIKSHEESNSWFLGIKNLIKDVISKSFVHFENQLVSESIELACKIVEESISPSLKNESENFKNFGMEIVRYVLEKIFSQDFCIIGSNKIRNWEDFKKNLSSFLRRIRQLCCLNIKSLFQYFQPILMSVFKSQNLNSIANVYFLLSEFCDRGVLERNILYQVQEQGSRAALGKVFCICLEWITGYRNCGSKFELIEVSILIFIEKLLSETLSSFNYEDNQIKITCELYRTIEQIRPALNPEAFLSFCYSQIASNLVNSDFAYASYTFEVLSTQLLKFKWGIKREYFKQTSIAKNVLNMCKNLSETNFSGEKLILRKQLFKIITNISFDDILDDYRTNINELITSLQKSLSENKWKAMYDLTGICQAIDTSVIYRYFMVTLQKSKIPVATIMNQLFSSIQQIPEASRSEVIKSILKLNLSMIENKGQRLSGTKNIFYNYKLISYLMPYWTLLLQQQQCSSENWDEIVLQIYRIFNTLLKNNNTNFFILERTIPSYNKFIQLFLNNMVNIAKWVQVYPKLFAEYRTSMTHISKELMEVIFCNKNTEVVKSFNNLLTIFMLLNIRNVELLSQGNKNNEENMEIYLEINKNVFKYLRNAKKLEHKVEQINNIGVLNENIQIKYDYILTLFKFGISNGKKLPRIQDLLCKVIHHMDFLARSAMPVISQKLGLPDHTRQDLLKVWSEQDSGEHLYNEELQDNEFLCCIKEWFKKCDSVSMIEPEY